MKGDVYNIKLDTPDKFPTHILDAAGCKNNREDQLRRKTRDLHTRVAKYSEVDGGISELLLCTVTDLVFMCHKLFI